METSLSLISALEAQLRAWLGVPAGLTVCVIEGTRPLYPEEEARTQHAVPQRRSEYATGRWCARQALAELGMPPVPILAGVHNEPLWPAGIAGSITHTREFCAAAVAPVECFAGLGIDLLQLEDAAALPPAFARHLTTPDELRLACAETGPHPGALALLFGAKESVVKVLSPRLGRLLNLPEIRLRFTGCVFEACLDGVELRVSGYWRVIGGVLLTFAFLPGSTGAPLP